MHFKAKKNVTSWRKIADCWVSSPYLQILALWVGCSGCTPTQRVSIWWPGLDFYGLYLIKFIFCVVTCLPVCLEFGSPVCNRDKKGSKSVKLYETKTAFLTFSQTISLMLLSSCRYPFLLSPYPAGDTHKKAEALPAFFFFFFFSAQVNQSGCPAERTGSWSVATVLASVLFSTCAASECD